MHYADFARGYYVTRYMYTGSLMFRRQYNSNANTPGQWFMYTVVPLLKDTL